MKSYSRILFFLLILPFTTFAQSNFKDGYIVSLKGDTIKGYVDYKEWERNPKNIFFKAAEKTAPEKFTPINISSFGVNGLEYYKSAIVKVSQGEVETSKLSLSLDTTYTIDTTFLRVVSSGSRATLYLYRDTRKDHFYISAGGAEPVELIYNVYLDDSRTNRVVQETYKRQLQKIAATYDPQNTALLNQVQQAKYTEIDLRKVVEQINVNKDQKYTAQTRTGTRFYAGAGINYGKVVFQFNDGFYDNSKSNASTLPKIAVGLDVLLNKNVGKVIFRNELSFSMAKANFTYSGIANTPFTGSIRFNQANITYTPQFLYNVYNTIATKVYLTLGGAANYAKYSNKKQKQVFTVADETKESEYPYSAKPENFFFNVYVGAGVVVGDKFDINLGYIPSTTIITGPGVKYTAIQFGINYLFGSK